MTESRRASDDELDRALRALGSELDYPAPADDLAATVTRRIATGEGRPAWWQRVVPAWLTDPTARRARPWQPLAAAAALVLVLFVGSLLAFPAVRQTVADWLGLRGIGITVGPTLSPLPTQHRPLRLGTPMSLADAQATVPWTILLPADANLGPPDEVYVDRSQVAEGIVSLVWSARPGFPAASTTGAGLLLTELRAGINEQFFQKIVGPGTTIERVHVGDHLGYWISGRPHDLYVVDPHGNPVFGEVRLAGDVLMWEDGEITLRIESALSKEDALRVGAAIP